MFIRKSTHEKEVFSLKSKIEGLQSELASINADRELEAEQVVDAMNKVQAQKTQIQELKKELESEERIRNKVSRGGFSKLRKAELLEEVLILSFQVDKLNEIIDELEATPVTKEEQLTEECANLDLKKADLETEYD